LCISSLYRKGASLGLGVKGIVSARRTGSALVVSRSVARTSFSLPGRTCEVGSGFDVSLDRADIVMLDIVDVRYVLDLEGEVSYAAFIWFRLGLRVALEIVLENDFFQAEDWLVGVLGVLGADKCMGVRGGFGRFADCAKGSEFRKECVLDADVEAEKELDRLERLALVDVTREARREDLRIGWMPVVEMLIIDALEGIGGGW